MPATQVPSVRLEPMDDAGFRASVRRSIRRHALDNVRRGLWRARNARAEAAKDFARFLPRGRNSAGRHFAHVIGPDGTRVGETWYTTQDRGGKCEFWIDWLTIDPAHRRKGYGRAALLALEVEAARRGADRLGLYVWIDNPGALALYTRLGYRVFAQRMTKPLGPRAARRIRPRTVRSAGTRRSRSAGRST